MTTSSPAFLVSSAEPFLRPAFTVPHQPMASYSPSSYYDTGRSAAMAPSKLPSLEGILKRIHREGSTDATQTQTQTQTQLPRVFTPPAAVMPQMPSLRSIISPSVAMTILPPAQSLLRLRTPVDDAHCSPAALSRKRQWDECSQTDDTSSDSAASDYMGSPVRVSSAAKRVATGPQRTRASKYCKVDGCERVSQRNNLCHSHGGKRLCKEASCSSKDRGNGYCIKHGGGKICSISCCEKKARRKGLCTQHFRVCDNEAGTAADLS